MNMAQKFCVLLWVVLMLIAIVQWNLGHSDNFVPELIIWGIPSVLLWGLVWVFQDRKK